MPDVLDGIELTVDIPERGLRMGTQGVIVECHPDDAYEVEVTNALGETLDLLALRPDQFIVIWRARTKTWVPIAERIAALMAHLPEEAGEEVLDFVRFMHTRRRQSLAGTR